MLTRAAGRPIVLDGLRPLQRGDQGVFFLRPAIQPGLWVLSSSQGRYLSAPDGTLTGPDQHDPLIDRLSRLTRTQLTTEVTAAARAADDGTPLPLPLPPSMAADRGRARERGMQPGGRAPGHRLLGVRCPRDRRQPRGPRSSYI